MNWLKDTLKDKRKEVHVGFPIISHATKVIVREDAYAGSKVCAVGKSIYFPLITVRSVLEESNFCTDNEHSLTNIVLTFEKAVGKVGYRVLLYVGQWRLTWVRRVSFRGSAVFFNPLLWFVT